MNGRDVRLRRSLRKYMLPSHDQNSNSNDNYENFIFKKSLTMKNLNKNTIREIAKHLNEHSLHQFSRVSRVGRNAAKNFKFAAMPLPKRVAYLRDEVMKDFEEHSTDTGGSRVRVPNSSVLRHQILSFVGSTPRPQLRKYIDVNTFHTAEPFNMSDFGMKRQRYVTSMTSLEWPENRDDDLERMYRTADELDFRLYTYQVENSRIREPRRLAILNNMMRCMDELLHDIDTDTNFAKEQDILVRIEKYLNSRALRTATSQSRKVYLYLAAAKARRIVKLGLFHNSPLSQRRVNIHVVRHKINDPLIEHRLRYAKYHRLQNNRQNIYRGNPIYSTIEVYVELKPLPDNERELMPAILANHTYSVELYFPIFKSMM
jgi:hypothetical protein